MGKQGRLIRSMFIRRLVLLGSAMGLVLLVLLGQTINLTIVHGAQLLEEAEARLVSQRWTPTIRGAIVDRKGRQLAVEEPAFDVLVEYGAITGEHAYLAAAREAASAHGEGWGALDPAERRRIIEEEFLPGQISNIERMWDELAAALGVERSEIEERKSAIKESVQHLRAAVRDRRRTLAERELEERKRSEREQRLWGLGGPSPDIDWDEVNAPIVEEKGSTTHVIASGVSDERAFTLRAMAERYPALRVEKGGTRSYPLETVTVELDRSGFPKPLREAAAPAVTPAPEEGGDAAPVPLRITVQGVATHILGWMRDVTREDVELRSAAAARGGSGEVDRGQYLHGDRVGATGIEAAYETELRGLRGRRITRLDTGREEFIPEQHGKTVRLTIDAQLQAKVQGLMSPEAGLAVLQEWHLSPIESQRPQMPLGTPIGGAAVVLEVDTGEVLAMVSTPSFTREQARRDPDSVWKDVLNAPWVNKAIAKPYPPGSIVKPFVLSAAVTAGVFDLDEAITCTGRFFPERETGFQCWVYKQFGHTHESVYGGGPLRAPEALAVSCNIFFYTLGQRLGIEGLRTWFGKVGVGSPMGLGVGDEYAGSVGVRSDGTPGYAGDAILMGIGQGPIAWTPLHAASVYATLARGGVFIQPRIVADQPVRASDLRLDPRAVEEALEGLRQSANEPHGTGSSLRYPDGSKELIFNVPGVRVWGKTGTAEAPPIVHDPDGEEGPEPARVVREGDHSWFVVLAGRADGYPKYAVAVIMEYAGSGGRVSGPICNGIVRALMEEGYF